MPVSSAPSGETIRPDPSPRPIRPFSPAPPTSASVARAGIPARQHPPHETDCVACALVRRCCLAATMLSRGERCCLAANGLARPDGRGEPVRRHAPPSGAVTSAARSRISSRTRAASAWPFIAFMTAPITAPAACTLPSRIFSSTSGCEASASSIAAMSAPSSETTARPRASTTSCGVPSPAMTPSSTWRASLSLSAPASTSDCRAATSAGVTRSDASRSVAFAMRVISPVHHLRAAAGAAPAATVASTSASSPPLTTSWNSRSVKPQSVLRRRRRAAGGSGSAARSSSISSSDGATGSRSGSGK